MSDPVAVLNIGDRAMPVRRNGPDQKVLTGGAEQLKVSVNMAFDNMNREHEAVLLREQRF